MSGQIITCARRFWTAPANSAPGTAGRLTSSDEALLAQFGRLQASLTGSLSIALAAGLLLVLASMVVHPAAGTADAQPLPRTGATAAMSWSGFPPAWWMPRRKSAARSRANCTMKWANRWARCWWTSGGLSTNLPADGAEIRERLDHMKSLAERTVGTVRDIALLLRPSMLDDLGLVAALEWQGREVSRRSEMEVAVESENVSDDLPDEYKICVYRLVQEALNNAVRHSQARNATGPRGRRRRTASPSK